LTVASAAESPFTPKAVLFMLDFRPALGAAVLASAVTALLVHGQPEGCAETEVWAPAAGGCVTLQALEAAEYERPVAPLAGRNGALPEGSLRAALAAKQAMYAEAKAVRGAEGQWREYGRGSLITNGAVAALQDAPGLLNGRAYYAGRVDNFAYDPVHKRLFAAVGTGGIWMSEAVNGDVRTLADLWVPVGDKLPTLVNGGVVWTSAGGETLIAAGGESVMGNNGYMGLGAFWSTDLGASWTQSRGFPDGAQVYNAKVDPGNPRIVYIASSKGLFRSDDAGRSFANVRLPTTPECAGVEDISSPCQFTNFVTDVVIQAPGGVTNVECSHNGPVLAAVGWRAGQKPFTLSGLPQAPANGLYRSETGERDSFEKLELPAASLTSPNGFAARERTGRIELGNAVGPLQDHGYVYALVQDSESFNNGFQLLDSLALLGTAINGAYVSADFGRSWTLLANDDEIALTPGSLGLLPGGQAWYNEWIQPDPTRQIPGLGIPTRLAFGLEEIFQNRLTHLPLNGLAQAGPQDFEVIGRYFSVTGYDTTTHPDQHAGLWIPYGDLALGIPEGVCLFAGHDGGVSRQCVPTGAELTNQGWGQGHVNGMYTLLPYGLAVAKDGTVWFGLQDNGSGHIEPDSRQQFMDFGADGFFAEVDPDNSDIAYTESQNGGLKRTTDRGASSTNIAPPYTRVNFANWFSMDPLDAQHMITGAQQVYETLNAETVTSSTWIEVYNLGFNPVTDAVRTMTTGDVHGDAIYVGFCGDCGHLNDKTVFQNGIATNVGGSKPPSPGTSDGWHDARAEGLDNRFIASIEIDPNDARTIYVTLAGYMANARPAGSHEDLNPNIGTGSVFKSTDAGETFRDISGNLPLVQVNSVIERDGQLLIGTDIGAFISTDTEGTEWAPLGRDLPNVPVTMLRLQPGNPDRVFVSTFGRGIWTYDFPADAQLASRNAVRFGGALAPLLLILLLAGAGVRGRRSH
jgi:hypothetical protein